LKRIYFTGHLGFSNRGCEAIVRSTVGLLQKHLGHTEVMLPSVDVVRDRAQWPDAADAGVRFVEASIPPQLRYWVHLQRLPIPALKRAAWPFSMPAALRRDISSADAVFAVGGDNYSLDYRIPALAMSLDSLAMSLGKPTILWGASVGPFEKEPHFVPAIKAHLAKMSVIAVRESFSVRYLRETLGLTNVVEAIDPAFHLQPQPLDTAAFWPRAENGVLGLNMSPVVTRYRPQGESPDVLLEEIASFIRQAVTKQGLGVILVPHVIPLDGSPKNNDEVFLRQILGRVADLGNRVTLMDPRLNAAQIKHVVSQCRFFIGARTHSTIAAFSSYVPTISIAYSVKAKGINQDLFGHQRYLLDSSTVNQATLAAALQTLVDEEEGIRTTLRALRPVWDQKIQAVLARTERALHG
jgi:colanic acid/amylovoran biosynthesis protein